MKLKAEIGVILDINCDPAPNRNLDQAEEELLELFKRFALEVIGKDERTPQIMQLQELADIMTEGRNHLRKELRTKIEEVTSE